MSAQKHLRDMAALYPNFKVNPSKLSGDLKLDAHVLKVDTDAKPEDWKVLDSATGNFLTVAEVKGAEKLTINEFSATYMEICNDKKLAEQKPLSPPAKREETPKRKKPASAKKKVVDDEPGMKLPIVYPVELQGSFMLFRQWTAQNNVIPADSEVVILEETEKSFRVSIAQAHISFDISKSKAEVVKA